MPRALKVELPGCPRIRVLCSDSLGLVKVVETESDLGAPKVVARWGDPDPQRGVLCMSMSSDASARLAIARKTNSVEIIDPASGTLEATFRVPQNSAEIAPNREGSNAVCGVHLFNRSSMWEVAVLTCTEFGDAALQRVPNLDKGDEVQSSSGDNDGLVATWNISQTGSVLCMRVDGSQEHAVFGGKGVDVNMWDIQKKTKIWNAKSPHRDSLGLISPAFVTAISFLSKEDHRKIAIGTGHHQVRLYDIAAQRRPVIAFDYGESPIRTVTEDPDGFSVYVGTGSGDLACFDIRTGKLIGGFKGKCAGSIRAVVRHPTLPLIASCGLDRYLRFHSIKTRQLLGSLFLKQQLVSVVFDTEEHMSAKAPALEPDTAATPAGPAIGEGEADKEVRLLNGTKTDRSRSSKKRASKEGTKDMEEVKEISNGTKKDRPRPSTTGGKTERAVDIVDSDEEWADEDHDQDVPPDSKNGRLRPSKKEGKIKRTDVERNGMKNFNKRRKGAGP